MVPIFGAAPLYIKKDKKWQMPLIMRPALRPRKRKMARGLQLDEKTTPIHQMRILKLRKEEERPRKLQAIKRKAEKIYRFCYALSALCARKHRVNQAHFAPRRCKAKKYIDFFF